MAEQAKWYVIHTYSGYENKVAENIRKVVENQKLQDTIPEVMVPTEIVSEVKDNKTGSAERMLFPSYVLVKMIMTDETWYIVRNTRGVTGFVGPGSKPIPLTDKEVAALGVESHRVELNTNFAVGDEVVITGDKLNGVHGIVKVIDPESRTVEITVSMFGRETAVSLPMEQIAKA